MKMINYFFHMSFTFLIKYQFINNLKMTQLIDISVREEIYLDRMPLKQYGPIKGLVFRGANLQYSLKTKNQNHFSFMLQSNITAKNLMFDISFSRPYTIIKIFIIGQNGNLFKIDSSLSRIHLIKKFFSTDSMYEPFIDPITGAVYFRVSYFSVKKFKEFGQFGQIDSILLNLNLQRLYESIQRLTAIDYFNQQYSLGDAYFGEKKYYNQLSKIVSLLCDSDSIDNFFNEQKQRQKFQEVIQSKKNQINQYVQFIGGKKKLINETTTSLLKKYTKNLDEQNQKLNALIKRKNGKSNYQPLLVNLSCQKIFKQTMIQMLSSNEKKKSLKVMQSQLGKVTINLQRQDEKIFKLKSKLLSSLPKNTQYHFLDKYFKNDLNVPVVMSLSLKQESFPRFLEVNRLSISIETKIRILLQISSAIHTFWQENKIILYLNNIKKIYITKNLTIKIRSLSQFFKVQPYMILQEKFMVNTKLVDNYLNLSQIYFKLFFNHNLIYIRPAKQSQVQTTPQIKRNSLILKNLKNSKLLAEGFNDYMKDLVNGLNYLFMSFVNKAIQLSNQQKRLRQSKKQVFTVNRLMKGSQSNKYQLVYRSSQLQIEPYTKLLNYKYTCSWLLKFFEIITEKSQI